MSYSYKYKYNIFKVKLIRLNIYWFQWHDTLAVCYYNAIQTYYSDCIHTFRIL